MFTELIWDGWCSCAVEKQRHQRHETQHIGDLAHVEGGRWCGLVIHIQLERFHQTRPWQVRFFEGAVEYQRYLDVILAIMMCVTGFWLQPVSGSQVESDKKLGAGDPTLFKKDSSA